MVDMRKERELFGGRVLKLPWVYTAISSEKILDITEGEADLGLDLSSNGSIVQFVCI